MCGDASLGHGCTGRVQRGVSRCQDPTRQVAPDTQMVSMMSQAKRITTITPHSHALSGAKPDVQRVFFQFQSTRRAQKDQTLTWDLLILAISHRKLPQFCYLCLSIAFSVLQQTVDHCGTLLRPATLGVLPLFALCVTTNSTVVSVVFRISKVECDISETIT